MNKLPLYHHISIVIIGIFIFFYILFLGQDILIPLTFSWIIAILLNPVVNFLMRRKINNIVAIVLAITLMIIVVGGILFFIGSQLSLFSDSLRLKRDKKR